jgi:hypothetical protein
MMRRWIGPVALCALALAVTTPVARARPASVAPPRSAAKPNFSGTWMLDTLKSEFGKLPGGRPHARTDVIEQRGSSVRQTLYLDSGSHRDTTEYIYVIGGKSTANTVDGRIITSTASWERNALHLDSKMRMFVFEWGLDERWALSPDAKTLTMSRHIKSPPMGEGEQTLVFRKQ